MRNFHPQFRRGRLDEVEGFILQPSSLILCFHKGDASQAQTSEQVGAQTAGVAVHGDSNTANTGNQIIIGSATDNSQRTNTRPWRPQDAGKESSGGGSGSVTPVVNATISNGLSSADVTAAISALASAFAPAVAPVAAAPKPATDAAPATPAFSLTTLQTVAAVAAIGGTAYLFLKRKKS